MGGGGGAGAAGKSSILMSFPFKISSSLNRRSLF